LPPEAIGSGSTIDIAAGLPILLDMGMAEDDFIIPPAVGIFGAATNRAGAIAPGVYILCHGQLLTKGAGLLNDLLQEFHRPQHTIALDIADRFAIVKSTYFVAG
jgi:hypothetical protein